MLAKREWLLVLLDQYGVFLTKSASYTITSFADSLYPLLHTSSKQFDGSAVNKHIRRKSLEAWFCRQLNALSFSPSWFEDGCFQVIYFVEERDPPVAGAKTIIYQLAM